MSSKTEQTRANPMDTVYLLVSMLMLLAGVAGYYWFADAAITAVRVAALIGIVVAAAFVAGQSQQGAAFFRFLKEADVERRKVVWPTHQETVQTAIMVIIVTILVSLMLAGIDWAIGATVRALVSGS